MSEANHITILYIANIVLWICMYLLYKTVKVITGRQEAEYTTWVNTLMKQDETIRKNIKELTNVLNGTLDQVHALNKRALKDTEKLANRLINLEEQVKKLIIQKEE